MACINPAYLYVVNIPVSNPIVDIFLYLSSEIVINVENFSAKLIKTSSLPKLSIPKFNLTINLYQYKTL